MKNTLFFCLSLITLILISSCKKEDENPSATTAATMPASTPDLFVSFVFDGAVKSYTSNSLLVYKSFIGSSSTYSYFIDFNEGFLIRLLVPRDSLVGEDLQQLVGKKIRIGSCGMCPTNIELQYDINDYQYKSLEFDNSLPNEYVKFNSVTFHKKTTSSKKILNQYKVTGEFNVKLNYKSEVKSASNGTFSLLFTESKY